MDAPKLFRNKRGTDVNALYPFILTIILVGMIIGIGVLILDRFSSSTFQTIDNYNDSIGSTFTNNTAIALDRGNITTIRVLNNSQETFESVCYSVTKGNGTFHFINQSPACDINGLSLNAIYSYKEYDTPTRNALSASSKEVAGISSDWLGLIITVMVLSIILFFVVRSFGPNVSR